MLNRAKKVLHSCFWCAIILVLFRLKHPGELAQLARAPALHAGGQGFESLILHHLKLDQIFSWFGFFIVNMSL